MSITEEVLETTILGRAINEASDKTIRAILKSVCAKSDEARREAESQLLVMPTDAKEGPLGKKSPVPRYAFCVGCAKEFDVMANTKTSCRYHPERSEPTGEDLYIDNYEEFDVDTDDMREEFPECFTFQYCDGNLEDNPDGCVIDFHKEQYTGTKSSKRARAF
ncbi:uncharacterized protein N7529_011581 [Penicillium soppii]|uniref:uncharacterized protein n=1 Tax=Penicillium soppii TaxID=69789 RepID=UPI002549897D|nr:uncharacterized protein N7529_011581 [Penicillium soppii]KAJ5852196.1 hypothetical protein N7529_011581 [Penicillium soppii]